MSGKTKTIIGIVLVVVFAVLYFYGVGNPEYKVVYDKASKICLECIGVG